LSRWKIRPRVLRDISKRNMKTEILGRASDIPIGVAPMAVQKLSHPEGEVGMARGTFY